MFLRVGGRRKRWTQPSYRGRSGSWCAVEEVVKGKISR